MLKASPDPTRGRRDRAFAPAIGIVMLPALVVAWLLRRPLATFNDRISRRHFVAGPRLALPIVVSLVGLLACTSSSPDEESSANAVSSPVATSTSVPVQTPTVQPAEVPTAAPALEVRPAYGNYRTIQEMPGTPADKDAISRLLEGSTPFIITENVIVAVENDLMTRPDTIIWFNKEEKATQLHSILLNTEDFPDAAEKLEMARKFGMYKAWRVADTANLRTSFEEYLERSKTEDLSFPLRMWDETGTTEIKGFAKDDMKLIINFVADDSMSLKRVGGATETSEQIIGNALRLNILSPNPASIGNYSVESWKTAQFTAGAKIAFTLASWRFPELDVIGKANIDSYLLLGDVEELYEYLVPERKEGEWNSIFTVE